MINRPRDTNDTNFRFRGDALRGQMRAAAQSARQPQRG
jgi:hypothetical protein